MSGYKVTIDFEKIIFDFSSNNSSESYESHTEISAQAYNLIYDAALLNNYRKEREKPLHKFEIEILNLQKLEDRDLKEFLLHLPNLNEKQENIEFTGISYTIKWDLSKGRNFYNQELIDSTFKNGCNIEYFMSQRSSGNELGKFLNFSFPYEYD